MAVQDASASERSPRYSPDIGDLGRRCCRFHARRQTAAVSYVLIYPHGGRATAVADHRAPWLAWTPDTARREAKRLLGSVAGGLDPAALKRAKRSARSRCRAVRLYLADAEAGTHPDAP